MDAQFQIISLLQKNLKQSILLQWIALLAEHLFTVSWPSGNMQEGHIIQTIEIYVCCSWGHEQNLSEGSEGLQESWLWQSRWQNCPDTVAFFICPWHWYQGGSSCCGRGLGPSHFFLSNFFLSKTQLAGLRVYLLAPSSLCFSFSFQSISVHTT